VQKEPVVTLLQDVERPWLVVASESILLTGNDMALGKFKGAAEVRRLVRDLKGRC
jgi:hypothetical protein